MQNAAPHKASLVSCETTLWFQANASCSSPYLDYRQVTSSIDDQIFKLLPSVSKVKFLQTQIRLNKAGIQKGPSHAKHFRWGTIQREIRWEHWSYPLLDILVLFGFCGSMVSSGDLPVLHGCNISPPAAAHLWSCVTFLFLQILLEGRRDSCPAQPSQPTAHGFLCCGLLPDISQTLMKWDPGFEWGSENIKGVWENAGKILPL